MSTKLPLIAALLLASPGVVATAQTTADASAPTSFLEPKYSFDKTGAVSRAAVLSLDAAFVFTADEDGSVKKLRADTGEVVVTIRLGTVRVNSLRLSADGKRLIVGSSDGTARVFETTRGGEVSRRQFPSETRSVWISSDGTRALAATGMTVCTWAPDDTSAALLGTFASHAGEVRAIDATPDGRFAISGGSDKTVCVWEPATQRTVATTRFDAEILAVAIDATGARVAAGDTQKTVCTWSPADTTTLKKYEGLGEDIVDLDLSDDGSKAVIAGTYRVLVIDAASAKVTTEFSRTRYRNYSARMQPDSRRIVVARAQDVDASPETRGTVKIFELP